MYDHVFFDADGTIFDFMAAEHWAISQVIAALGLDPDGKAAETYSHINNGVWLEFEQKRITLQQLKTERFRRFLLHHQITGNPKEISNRYEGLLAQTYHLYDDALPVLDTIRNAGIPMSLITNGIAQVQRGRLRATGTASYFKAIVISEEIGIQKPDPRYFSVALRKAREAGTSAEHPLVVGDSPTSDIRGGIAAGWDTCWVNRFGMTLDHDAVPTHEISSLLELPRILGL